MFVNFFIGLTIDLYLPSQANFEDSLPSIFSLIKAKTHLNHTLSDLGCCILTKLTR